MDPHLPPPLPDFEFILSLCLQPALTLCPPHLKKKLPLGGDSDPPPIAPKAAGWACTSCKAPHGGGSGEYQVSFCSHLNLTVKSPLAFSVLAGRGGGTAQTALQDGRGWSWVPRALGAMWGPCWGGQARVCGRGSMCLPLPRQPGD